MALAHVQSKVNSNTSTTTIAGAYASNVTSGNLLVVLWEIQGTALTQPTTVSISDTIGNVWIPVYGSIQNVTGVTPKVSVQGWCCVTKSSGANTVTLTYNASGTVGLSMLCTSEFSGWTGTTATIDSGVFATSAGGAAGTYAFPTLTFVTNHANEVIFAIEIVSGTNSITSSTYTAPFTKTATGTANLNCGYHLPGAAGTYNENGTWVTAASSNGIIAFGVAIAQPSLSNALMLMGCGT